MVPSEKPNIRILQRLAVVLLSMILAGPVPWLWLYFPLFLERKFRGHWTMEMLWCLATGFHEHRLVKGGI